jgi:hypothetical protein
VGAEQVACEDGTTQNPFVLSAVVFLSRQSGQLPESQDVPTSRDPQIHFQNSQPLTALIGFPLTQLYFLGGRMETSLVKQNPANDGFHTF